VVQKEIRSPKFQSKLLLTIKIQSGSLYMAEVGDGHGHTHTHTHTHTHALWK